MKDYENMNLFAVDGGNNPIQETPPLSVMEAKLIEFKNLSYPELFSGFDEIYAATYSITPKQVDQVMRFFKKGEIIIGSPSQVRRDMAMLFAAQEYNIDFITKTPYLQNLIKEGKVTFYVTIGSHGKLYLLRAQDGRCRIITSSANFSVAGWNESQFETYVYFDNDEETFEKCMSWFEVLRDTASKEIGIKAKPIAQDGSNLDEMPLSGKVIEVNHAVVIKEVGSKEDASYALALDAKAKEWEEILNKAGIKNDKEGYPILVPKNITKIKMIKKELAQKSQKDVIINPEFKLDYVNQTASFAGNPFDLNPSDEEVKSDIQCMFDYVKEAEIFNGNTTALKMIYWKILIYMFISPFLAKFRMIYNPYAPDNSVGKHFPMYMVLRGDKNGGKSSIIRTGQILMFGKALNNLNADDFTPKNFEGWKFAIKGIPALIDDVPNSRAKYLTDIVKNESNLLNHQIDDHGVFIMTSNEMQKLRSDLLKRMIVFQIDNQVSDDRSLQEERVISQIQMKMGNAFYRRYLKEVFPVMIQFLNFIVDNHGYYPEKGQDIFWFASEVFIKVIKEFDFSIPEELRPFHWSDYMSETIKSEKFMSILVTKFFMTPEIFKINKENDTMNIDFSNQDMKYSMLEAIAAGLPTDVEASLIGSTMSVKWSEMKTYANCDFQLKKGFISKVKDLLRGD